MRVVHWFCPCVLLVGIGLMIQNPIDFDFEFDLDEKISSCDNDEELMRNGQWHGRLQLPFSTPHKSIWVPKRLLRVNLPWTLALTLEIFGSPSFVSLCICSCVINFIIREFEELSTLAVLIISNHARSIGLVHRVRGQPSKMSLQ